MGIDITAPFTGRCNHFAREAGLAVVDHERVDALNELDELVTVATLPPYARVTPRQMVATVKIIPYAAPRSAVDRAIEVAKAANQPLISVAPVQGDARRPGADPTARHARQGPRQGGRHDRQATDLARQHAGRRAPLRP